METINNAGSKILVDFLIIFKEKISLNKYLHTLFNSNFRYFILILRTIIVFYIYINICLS